jgi:hypothetical protein
MHKHCNKQRLRENVPCLNCYVFSMRVDVQLHPFITPAPEGGKISASLPGGPILQKEPQSWSGQEDKDLCPPINRNQTKILLFSWYSSILAQPCPLSNQITETPSQAATPKPPLLLLLRCSN